MPQRRDHVTAAKQALSGQRWPVAAAPEHIPPTAGLYAIYGDHDTWGDLGYDYRADTPLYIGKSERNLVERDLTTHFAVDKSKPARTGSSTVRRSFAALLRDHLNLRAVPRNPDKPGLFLKEDPLLKAVGMSSVYYLVFRQALAKNFRESLDRAFFVQFEFDREQNKLIAQEDEATANYDLLEFGRFAQSPNDAVAVEFRCNVLLERLGQQPLSERH